MVADFRQLVREVLFDFQKLPIPKKARGALQMLRRAFPRPDGHPMHGNYGLFLLTTFKPVHEDAVVDYLELMKGWPLQRPQEIVVRLEADTQISLEIARDQPRVFRFYEDWITRIEHELPLAPKN